MIFMSLCAFIWFKNIEKMLLQMTSGFLQLESTIGKCTYLLKLFSCNNSGYLIALLCSNIIFKFKLYTFIFTFQ
jgi:hypothetical protein